MKRILFVVMLLIVYTPCLAATLSAAPKIVTLPPGVSSGTTTLTWNAPEAAPGSVVLGISVNDTAEAFSSTFPYNGNSQATYITAGNTFKFNLYKTPHVAGNPALATTTVYGLRQAGVLTASPAVVVVPAGASTGSTTLTWRAVGVTNIVLGISENGQPQVLSSQFPASGSSPATYIAAGSSYNFKLYKAPYQPGSPSLATITVTGVAAPATATCNFSYTIGSPPPANLAVLGNNKTVCLHNGNYNFSAPIQMATGQTLQSYTGDRVAVVVTSTADRIVDISSGGTVRNITLHGTAHVTTYGVLAYHTNGAVIDNAAVRYSKIGVGFVGSTSSALKNSLIEQTGDLPPKGNVHPSIYVTAGGTITVRDNVIHGVYDPNGVKDSDGGSAFYDTSAITFINNYIYPGGIIYLVNVNAGTVSTNINQGGSGAGIDLVNGTKYVAFINNYVEQVAGPGAVIASTQNLSFQNTIYVDNNQSHWIYCNGLNVFWWQNANTNNSTTITGDISISAGIPQYKTQCKLEGISPP